MAKFEINVSVNGEASIKSLDDKLKSVDTSAQKASKSTDMMTSSLKSLGAVIASVGLYELGKKAIQTADTMNLLEGRVSLVTKSIAEQIAVQKELFKVSQNTRQGLEATTTLYTNLASSMTAMGKSQHDIIKMTETVNKAMVISGSSTQMAQAAILQLGQAFASGTLRGDELNAIMENSKGLAQAIASGMGVPIGKLRELGSQGKITSEILAQALEKSASDIDAKFAKLPQTVGQSITQVENSIMSLVGVADDAVNGSGGLSEIFSQFSKYLDQNQAEVIEFGSDFLRVMQLIGAATLTTIDGVKVLVHGVTGGIIGAVELSINSVLFFINSAIAMAEAGYNKIRSLGGFDAKSLGRIANVDLGSKSQFANMKKDASEFTNGLKTMGVLFDEIANNTTVIKTNVADLNKKPLPDGKGGAGGKDKKGAKEKTPEQIREEEHKANQEILNGIQKKTDAQTKYYDMIFDLDQKLIEEQNQSTLHNAEVLRDAYNSALALIQSSSDKINTDMMGIYETINAENERLKSEGLDPLFDQTQMTSFFSKWQESIEDIKSSMDFSSSIEFDPAGLEGTAKAIAGIGKATEKLAKAEAQYQKNKSKTNATAEELAANEEDHTKNQLLGYAAMAASMSSMFNEGSVAAERMLQVQQVLGIVEAGVAIAKAGQGDPYTAIPRVIAMAALMSQFVQGFGGGSSGGGGVSAPTENFEANKEQIEISYSPMTDRLDRQIELLESIDRNGSASELGVTLAGTSFERDYKLWVEGTLENSLQAAFVKQSDALNLRPALSPAESRIGADVYKYENDVLSLNTDVLRDGLNLVKALIDIPYANLMLLGRENLDINSFEKVYASSLASLNEVQNLINDWALGIVDSMDDLKGASKEFKSIFDDITGTTFYETKRLSEAYEEVDRLRGSNSLADYLKNTITSIDELENFFTDETFSLLMSNNANDIEAQVNKISELSAKTGVVFEGGAREALNYLESIQLVAEDMTSASDAAEELAIANEKLAKTMNIAISQAMINANKIYDSFINSLKSKEQINAEMAGALGVTLATNAGELSDIINKLTNDFNGLTSADISLINANKGMLVTQMSNTDATKAATDALNENKKEISDYLSTITSGISTLDSTLSSLQDTIDTLRGSAIGSSYTLDMYNKSMATTLSLSGSSDYEGFAKSLQETIGYSSALSDSSAYQTSQEMAFAQLVAANQFAGMQVKAMSQIDYLKLIEENTKTQIASIEASINSASKNTTDMMGVLNAQLLALIDIKTNTKEAWIVGENNTQSYASSGGAVATGVVGATAENIMITGKEGTSFSEQEAINYVKNAITTGDIMSIYTSALKYGISSTSLDNMMGWTSGTSLDWAVSQGLPKFLSGGYTGDMSTNSIAGIVHGKEYVVNAKTTRDLGINNSGGLFREMVNELRNLKNEVIRLNDIAMSQLREAMGNNAGFRQVTNGYQAMMIEVI